MVRTAGVSFLGTAPTTSHLQAITIGCHIRESCQLAPNVLQFFAQYRMGAHGPPGCTAYYIDGLQTDRLADPSTTL